MSRLRTAALCSVFGLASGAALGQQPSVPAIQANASAAASASATGAASTVPAGNNANVPATPPAGWPPNTVKIPLPSVKLDKKEAIAANLSAKWRDKRDTARLDSNGVLRWIYGNSQTRLVCAPLNICDIELKPGETINNIRMGDTGFWSVTLAISGGSEGRVTHAAITPLEAGRETSMLIYTDQRTYSIRLVSTERSYTSKTGFTYPEAPPDMQDSIASYKAAIGAGAMKKGGPVTSLASSQSGDVAHIELLTISGDNPSWKPLNAYTDGRKTYIVFPEEMQFGDSPSLLGINNDGGIFSSPTERRVIYRWMGNRLIADTVMDRLKLVLGVGGSQTSVYLTRRGK